MRMIDAELERKIVELINEHLYPEIVLRILKYFTRNIHDADANLHVAWLIRSDAIIRSIYEPIRASGAIYSRAIPDKEHQRKAHNAGIAAHRQQRGRPSRRGLPA